MFLRGAAATGAVFLVGAKLGGNLECDGATFRVEKGGDGLALTLDGSRVDGVFFLRKNATIAGVLDLTAPEFGSINDDARCWLAQGGLILDRCRYGAFTGGPVDAESRLDWLVRQDPARWGVDFWPQPYEQLAKVLREMGHREDARKVLIEKERLQRAARRKREKALRPVLWLWDGILHATVDFGHRPLWAFAWLLMFLGVGWSVFALAVESGAIKPNTAVVLRSEEWVTCADAVGQTQVQCFLEQPRAATYPRFNAFIYSADTLLPIVDLEMQGFWIPDDLTWGGAWARGYLWVHIAVGWALSLLAVAGFSGLVKSD